MRWCPRDLAAARRRSLLVLLAVALLLAPSLAALEHPAHETPEVGLVHVEATHPHAAPHLEQEEHSVLEDCAVCLQAGRAAVHLESHSWRFAVVESRGRAAGPVWVAGLGVGPAQPRGPPA